MARSLIKDSLVVFCGFAAGISAKWKEATYEQPPGQKQISVCGKTRCPSGRERPFWKATIESSTRHWPRSDRGAGKTTLAGERMPAGMRRAELARRGTRIAGRIASAVRGS